MEKELSIEGEKVSLRDARPSDTEKYVRWMQEGEWRKFDAPWEEKELRNDEIEKKFEKLFLGDKTEPRERAIIRLSGEQPIGWVNRYSEEDSEAGFLLGIDICEDEHLNKGVGTEALSLWIDHLFENSEVDRLGLNTYSFNERMMSVAEKLGFVKKDVDEEAVHWRGKNIDRIRYVLSREEWVTSS